MLHSGLVFTVWISLSVMCDSLYCCLAGIVAQNVPGVLQDFRPDLVLYDASGDPHADAKSRQVEADSQWTHAP